MQAGGARRPGNRAAPLGAAVAGLLLVSVAVHAVFVGQQAVVTPVVKSALPVTLAAGPNTVVTAGTSAVTTGLVPPLAPLSTSTVTMSRAAPDNWKVVLVVTSASGITTFALNQEVLVLSVVGSATQSLTLTQATTYPQSTSGLTLAATGLTLTVATTSLLGGCHSCSVTAELRITPPSTSLPLFVYPYTITTAA